MFSVAKSAENYDMSNPERGKAVIFNFKKFVRISSYLSATKLGKTQVNCDIVFHLRTTHTMSEMDLKRT